MPLLIFRIAQFLCCHISCRPRSHEASSPAPHDGANGSRGTGLDATPASCSRRFSAAVGNVIEHQTSPGHISADRASNEFNSEPLRSSRAVTSNAVVATETPVMNPRDPVTLQPTHLPCYISPIDPIRYQQSPAPLPSSKNHTPQPQYQNEDILSQAHNFTITGATFNNVNVTTSNQFMKALLKETIPGAAFDSSSRYPPPRCHPGTRLAVLERCLHFIAGCDGVKKMRWVVGAAGVGKSAIMQNIAESPHLSVTSHASVFLSINGRNDGTKTIVTLSYQFAVKSEVYRQVIEGEITRIPTLLQSSMIVQFKKLIVEPFIYHPQLNSAGRFLVVIDGLDECDNPHTQQELLRLISDFCITYPSSPIVWLIASRPEPHIISFFSRPDVIPTYEKEEIPVNSDEARADVERYLRNALTEIKEASESLDPEWPKERDLWKLTDAAGGLFAYAHTVIRYIGDSAIGNPALQLSDVLHVVESHPRQHPMALLDALYAQILSHVPSKIMINTRKLLLALVSDWDWALYRGSSNFILLCNWLGMTADEAYFAINPLRSVFHVPRREQAHKEVPRPFHKSIIDYLCNFDRSRFSLNIKNEAQQYRVQCALRISRQAPDGVDFGDADYKFHYGNLARGPGTGGNISLTWPADEEVQDLDDNILRLMMYKTAIGQVVSGIERREQAFQNQFCVRLLISGFQSYGSVFPYDCLRDLVFDSQRREEFMTCGILKRVPLKFINFSNDVIKVKFRLHRPASITNLLDPWNPSCDNIHEQDRELEEGKDDDWTTNLWRDCQFCLNRLEDQLETKKALSPDHIVSILFTSTGSCCVEFHFVDSEDGVSEWTYWFWITLPLEERKMYGSTV